MAKCALALTAAPAVAFAEPSAKGSEPTFSYVYADGYGGDGFHAQFKVRGRGLYGPTVYTREEAAAHAQIMGEELQRLGRRLKKPLPSGLSFEVDDDTRNALVATVQAVFEGKPVGLEVRLVKSAAAAQPPASGYFYVYKERAVFRVRLKVFGNEISGEVVGTCEEGAAQAKIVVMELRRLCAAEGVKCSATKPLADGLTFEVADDVQNELVAMVRAAFRKGKKPQKPRKPLVAKPAAVAKPIAAAAVASDNEEVVEGEEDEEDVDDDYSVHDSSEDEREEVPPEPVEPELSEYEQLRKANIERNAAFMQSLGLGGGDEAAAKKRKAPKRKPRGPPREGSRKSPRLA